MPVEKIQLPEGCPPLTGYYFYLTGGCNLACQHCWIAPTYRPNGDTGGHLDYALFVQAIEGLPLGLYSVKLTGGEPLLHPDFVRIVDFVAEKELSLVIETNGTLMTESLAQHLKSKSIPQFISVSVDGADPETHDAFRGVKGSFEKTRQGIGYLVEAGYRPQIIMSLHAGNVDQIEALVRLAETWGAGSVKFNLVQSSGRGAIMSKRGQVLDVPAMIEIGKWVEKDLQKQVSLQLFYSWPRVFHGLKYLLDHSLPYCNLFGLLGILSTGQIAMCGIGVEHPELVYGQLGVDDLATLWTSHPTLLQIRRELPSQLEGICGRCLMREQCMGYCVAENFHAHHRLTAPFWFCQQAEEDGLFPVGRCIPESSQIF